MKQGDIVRMKVSHAKWYLNNPEVYEVTSTGEVDDDYEQETLVHLLCCLGEPVYGILVDRPFEAWLVVWRVPGFKPISYYVDRRHMELVP